MSRPKARVVGGLRPATAGLRTDPESGANWTTPPAAPVEDLVAAATRTTGDRWLLGAAALEVAAATWLGARARGGGVQLTADFHLWEPANNNIKGSAPCDAANPCAALPVSHALASAPPRALAAVSLLALAAADVAAACAVAPAARRWAPSGATVVVCHALVALATGATDVCDVALGAALTAAGAMLMREAEEAPVARRARLVAAASVALCLATVVDCVRAAMGAAMSGAYFPARARAALAAQALAAAGLVLLQAAWLARAGRVLAVDAALRRALDAIARTAAIASHLR